MLDDLLVAFNDDSLDPLLGLTCDIPFVRRAVNDGLCPLCGSKLDTSTEALRVFAIVCRSPFCSFIVKPRARSRMSH